MDDLNSLGLQEITETYDFKQVINSATHRQGGFIDLVLVKKPLINRLGNVKVLNTVEISDHYPVVLDLHLNFKNISKKVMIKSQKITESRISKFSSEIIGRLSEQNAEEVNEMVDSFNTVLSELCEEISPIIIKEVRERPQQCWFNDSLKLIKQEKRRAERRWLKNPCDSTRNYYNSAKNEYYSQIIETRAKFYKEKIAQASGDLKIIFNVVKELSNDKNQNIYPVSIKKDELPDKFAEFFDQKIDNIRKNIAEQNTPPLSQHHNSDGRVRETGPLLKEFKTLNMNELQDLFKKMRKKILS